MSKLKIKSVSDISIIAYEPGIIRFDVENRHYRLEDESDNFKSNTGLYEVKYDETGNYRLNYVLIREVDFNIDDYIHIPSCFKGDIKCAEKVRFVKALEMNGFADGPFSEEWSKVRSKISTKAQKISEVMAESIKMCDNLKKEQRELKENWLNESCFPGR
jgi:hypothetical protein